MDNTGIRNRIREALQIRNIKQVELAKKTGISKGTINNWLHNRYQPKSIPLNKMARALDVNEFWLAGYDVPMERNLNPNKEKKSDEIKPLIHSIITDKELENLIMDICNLTPEQRQTIISIVNELNKINSHH